MSRITRFAIISVVLGALAAAQETPAPAAPPAPPAPVVKARPSPAPVAVAVAATAAKPAKPSSYLGVDIRDVTHDRMAALKLKDARGVEITMVDGDAPAGKAGLKEHDVVLSFNGRNLQGSEDLRKLIRETPPGQTVELGISRDGKPMTIKAQLADRRRVVVMAPRVEISRIRIPRIGVPIITTLSSRNGVLVENLTPQLGEVFGVKDGEGVLIRSVEKGSPGEAAGLRAGDVIVRVGNQKVAGTPDWNRLMREQKAGPVQLGIMRDKRQQTLSLTVPEHSREQSDTFPGMEEFPLNMEDFGHNMQDFKLEMRDLQRLQPEIERSMREAQEKIQRELERSQRDWERSAERAQREAERAQEQAQRAQEQAQRAAERAQRAQEKAQREAERAQEQAQRDQEKAPPEAPTNPPAPPAQPPSPPQ
ncbi:MAG: PDZ domain-containing protein [Acidobacteriia bacterium]|nr:PDZ domain-containing protein [Terriglobia bacterium]